MRGASDGFTLIEIVIVLVIIGIIGTLTVPRFFRKPLDVRKVFVARLNAATLAAWRGTAETQTVHRVLFDLLKGEVRVERASRTGPLESYVTEQFVQAPATWGTVRFDLDQSLVIRRVIIEGKDESSGNRECWFFVDPDEASQEVTVVVADEKSGGDMTLVLNPFTKKFSEDESVYKTA